MRPSFTLSNPKFKNAIIITVVLVFVTLLLQIEEWNSKPQTFKAWGLISTSSSHFIAVLLERELERHGYNVTVFRTIPKTFSLDIYILLNPKEFGSLPLPSASKLIIYRTASIVRKSTLVFTKEYIAVLKNSRAVLEHEADIIDSTRILIGAKIPVSYLPVGAILPAIYEKYRSETMSYCGPSTQGKTQTAREHNFHTPNKLWDMLVRGNSIVSTRSDRFIAAMKNVFSVIIVNSTDLYMSAITNVRVCIVLHEEVNDLLDYTLIQELVSRGTSVVAENAQNREQYAELEQAVSYFEEDSVQSLLKILNSIIEHPPSRARIDASISFSQRRFEFMFSRFLLSVGILSMSAMRSMPLYFPNATSESLVLSIPEFYQRRQRFLKNSQGSLSFTIFDGIVLKPSWIGCGASYMILAQHAIRHGMSKVLIVEDDVIFHSSFSQRLASASRYLATLPSWDIFSGLIVDVTPATRVLDVQFFNGSMFVILDRMTSTVCNMYNKNALELLAHWNINDRDDQSNTIDRYLNRLRMTVVTTMPYLVDHERGSQSTLWKVEPDHYSSWIQRSQRILMTMSMDFLKRHRDREFHHKIVVPA